jgi:beta-lactamase class A
LKNKIHLLVLLIALIFNVNKVESQRTLPVDYPGDLPDLRELKCEGMEKILREEIYKNKHWKKLVENKKMAIGVVDLANIHDVRFAGLNEDHMIYAASLPKIAVLLAVMDAIDKKEVVETAEVKRDLHLMISKSNNAAATRMIDLVGFEKIESVLRDVSNRFYDEDCGGGLWCGKRYAKSGKRYPDPVAGLSHGATTSMVSSFYYKLFFGQLISKKRSAEMLQILKDPALHHKFVNTLQTIAPNASVYRKSGSWKNYHADSVLVWGPERSYILVALIDDPNGESIIRELVVPLEKVLKESRKVRCNH